MGGVTAGAAHAWFVAGTIPFIIFGGLHALLALRDCVHPRAFAPVAASVRPAMEGTGIRLRRRASPSVWSVWLGIHIGFGLGLSAFALLLLLIATHDPRLVERIAAIRPLAIAVSAACLALSLRFFFFGPALIAGTATLCFTIATLLA